MSGGARDGAARGAVSGKAGADNRVAGPVLRPGPASPAPVPRGLDWPGLMRAGLRGQGVGLGLKPSEFWDLTPAELALMLGIEPGAGAMTRTRLDDLMTRFPDRAKSAPENREAPG